MKSTKHLEAIGAYDKNPSRRRPPAPPSAGALGSPPAWMNQLQVDIWFELAQTAPLGVLTAAERPLIANYCRLEARMRLGEAELERWESWTGVNEDDRPPRPSEPNPAYFGRMESILSKCGMTPLDRQRVGVEKPRERGDFDDL